MDPTNMLALILIASFAIDRIATGLMFLFSFTKVVADPGSSPEAKRRYQLLYYAIAGVFSILFILNWGQLQILSSLGLRGHLAGSGLSLLDMLLTLIVLVGGADRISALLETNLGSVKQSATTPPLVISGTIKLEDRDARARGL